MIHSVRKKETVNDEAFKYDVALLFPVLFLVGIGIVMVYSASSALALKTYGSDLYFLKKQAVFAVFGFFALMMCRHIHYRTYRILAYPILMAAIVFLAAVKIPGLGHAAGGAERWLRIGGVTFQPSEFAKPALVIYFAYSMSKKADLMQRFSIGLFPHLLVFGLMSVFMLIQPDFGSVVILAMITWIMLFVGGARVLHLSASLLALSPIAVAAVLMAPYRFKRLLSFLNPWAYQTDEGYQIVHSLMAFGTGGLCGTGIGKGYQKLFYLPEPHTDFIFSVIGEELGLAGVLFILGLYVIIFIRGIRIALETPDTFGSLLATGLTAVLGLQVCINMGVALGLLPTKGLTLPFLSYGGSSLIFSMASAGILMNISAQKSRTAGTGPVRRRSANVTAKRAFHGKPA
ncbi:MAG: putative lipid II flippase FtsW [Desulfobacterales bacterium]